jgi:hypothetical protein
MNYYVVYKASNDYWIDSLGFGSTKKKKRRKVKSPFFTDLQDRPVISDWKP